MWWIDALVAVTALWGAGLSSWIWLQDLRLSKPQIQIHSVADDFSLVELRVTNRSKEPIVVFDVTPAMHNMSLYRSASPENETLQRIVTMEVAERPEFHLPIEGGASAKLRLYFVPESVNSVDVHVHWHFDRPSGRIPKRSRANWSWQELSTIRDHAAEY